MKGIHRIVIQNKRVRYDFELRRNLTILRGDSATGKTTLIDMVREYMNNGAASSIDLACDKACYVLEGATWKGQLSQIQDSIVFIDEGNPFIWSDEFSKTIQGTDNYYVIVSREGLPNLPYSITEIYGIRTSGKYGGLKQQYNEFYHIYGSDAVNPELYPGMIITEDSNSGFQFFYEVCSDAGIDCISAGGKSNILLAARSVHTGSDILLIADGAAFGPEMDRVMKYLKGHTNIRLYAPESFEWLILSADLLNDSEIREALKNPSESIESRNYFSWEQFFTRLLTEKTDRTWLQYSKARINPAYLKGDVREAILKKMEKIHFSQKSPSGSPQ